MSDRYQTVEEPTEADEASLDSGNRKLGLIAGGVVLLLGAAIAFGPAANRERIANGQMPTFELAGASVVAERPTEEAAAAAPTEAASSETETKTTTARAARPSTVRSAAAVTSADAPAPAPEAAPMVEEAAPAPAPAVEEAPRNVTLTGRVLDENGKPLAGATVFVKGTRQFASTDQNGNYTVEAPAGDNSLVYGYGGYQDQEMRASAGQKANVTLLPSESGKRRRR